MTASKDHLSGMIEANWQVTAMTIHCDKVDHEATIMVYNGWNTSCAYFERWGPIRRQRKTGIPKAMAWLGIGSEERHISSDCPGPDKCPYAKEYCDKLYQDETTASAS